MTSLVWLVFALYLNQMSCQTMLPTIHMRMIRTKNQTKFRYISVLYGQILVSSLYNYNEICLPVLLYPRLSCASHQTPVDAYFFQGDIKEPVYGGIFSYHPLLKTHSNQEHDNENIHPPFSWGYLTTRWKNNSFYSCVKTVQLVVRTSCIFIYGLVIGVYFIFAPALAFFC